VPDRQAYSHCDSLGNVTFRSHIFDNASQNAIASHQVTCSTGRFSPLDLDGFLSITA
jgi:hypothetical protein